MAAISEPDLTTVTHTEDKELKPVPDLPPINTIRVPFLGTFATVGYVDLLGTESSPLCLCLHGAPGGIKDFIDLMELLKNAGVRLIIPEFPGYGVTKVDEPYLFDESTSARTELMKNFLTVLNIARVTAVIAHSMGMATALHLASSTDLCQSVVSLSGIGLQPHRPLRPQWFIQTSAYVLRNNWTGPLAGRLLAFGYRLQGFNLRNENSEDLKIGLISGAGVDFEQVTHSELSSQVARDVSHLKEINMPVLFAITKNDRLVEWYIADEIARHCGVDETDFTYFDVDEQVIQGPTLDHRTTSCRRALVFERGGHFVHRSHRDVVCRAIVDFVTYVNIKPPSSE